MDQARRISDGLELGRAKRSIDLALGVLGVMPVVILAAAVFALPAERPLIRFADLAWTSCLLAFLSGVRRGLTFSEAGGARLQELASMLAVFFFGVLTAIVQSLWIGALGLLAVGALDAVAARRLEAPSYFVLLRPIQMLVGAAALALTALYT